MSDQPDWILPTVDGASRVIVSVGIGTQHYRRMLRSTENHCAVHCPETLRLFYDVLPQGCPTHEQLNYGFKFYALRRAIASGSKLVLWMDATFQPVAPIEKLWAIIEREGYYIAKQGDSQLGGWTTDKALNLFVMTRDDAMNVPLVLSGLVGLNMESTIGQSIWRMWNSMAIVPVLNGPHFNISHAQEFFPRGAKWAGFCSFDPRCQGHRHDESALSFVLHRLRLQPMVEDFAGLGLGRHVPDYDVVEMRNWIVQMRGRQTPHVCAAHCQGASMTFSYGPISGQPQEPCCACNEYTKNHLITPHGGYYLCQPCIYKLAEGEEVGA